MEALPARQHQTNQKITISTHFLPDERKAFKSDLRLLTSCLKTVLKTIFMVLSPKLLIWFLNAYTCNHLYGPLAWMVWIVNDKLCSYLLLLFSCSFGLWVMS